MKPSRPADGPFNAQFAAEQSGVRPREQEATIVSRSDRPSGATSRERIGERSARIDAKIREAERLLPRLGPADPRLRILCSAILRKDEVLLDAILRAPSTASPLK